jgi:hypothetical protein
MVNGFTKQHNFSDIVQVFQLLHFSHVHASVLTENGSRYILDYLQAGKIFIP